MVMDRLFLWIFTVAVLVGTVGIILQVAPLAVTAGINLQVAQGSTVGIFFR